jgi:NADPH:quinone reductase-like Zn-dependent oxidoreductase
LKEAEDLPVEKILVDSTFGYEDLEAAFERLNTGRARGKVVVEVDRA